MKLLDSNILLYALDDESPLQERARLFLNETLSAEETVALPWLVVLSVLRISTTPRIFRQPLAPARALEIVGGWLALPNVMTLEPGPEHWRLLAELMSEPGNAGRRTNDTHLAALAIERGAELCSADADFARYRRLKWTNPFAR